MAVIARQACSHDSTFGGQVLCVLIGVCYGPLAQQYQCVGVCVDSRI